MKQLLSTGLIAAAVIFLVVLFAPLLVPIPPLQGTRPPQELGDPDSQFIDIKGLSVHVKSMGQGEPAMVLLHGFGANLYSWQPVMQPLSQIGRVIAFDRPAFGLTERPLRWEGQNPYSPEAQVMLVLGLLNHYGIQQAVLVGNSAGGAIAIQFAQAYPERVSALVLVDPAVSTRQFVPAYLKPLLATPQMRRLGPLLIRQAQKQGPQILKFAWHDPAKLKPETVAQYKIVLQADDWDRALWEFVIASHDTGREKSLDELMLPILVVTGDDDRIIPTADSIRLAGELPNARLVVIENAGHVPHEERPSEFINTLKNFFMELSF